MDDWNDADIWRLTAEEQYTTNLRLAKQKNDGNSLADLELLREESDELEEFRRQDLLAYFLFDDDDDQLTLVDGDSSYMDTETMEEAMVGPGGNGEAGTEFEDAVAATEVEVENTDEVAVDIIAPSIRSASRGSVYKP